MSRQAGSPPLPQQRGGLFLADGGIETSLIFLQGLELPEGLKSDTRNEKAAVKTLEDADWGVILRAAGALGKIGTDRSRRSSVRRPSGGR